MAKNPKIQKARSIVLILIVLCIYVGSLAAEGGDTLNTTEKSSDYIETKNYVQDEVLEQSPVKKFLHSLDEKKNFRFLLVFILIVFIIMLFLPFSPAIQELIQKKDDQPLFVSMNYSKDPRFFDHSFRNKLKANVDQVGVDRCFRVTLSDREELIEVIDAKNVSKFNFGKHALYLEGDAQIENKMKFSKEVYVTGKTNLQEKTKIRAILSEKDLFIGAGCIIVRWVGSEENIFVSSDCDLGVRCTCEKTLQLSHNCKFKSLYGHPIITDSPVKESEELFDETQNIVAENDDPEALAKQGTDNLKDLQNGNPDEESIATAEITDSNEESQEYDKLLEKPLYETITFRRLKDDKSTITHNTLMMSKDELSLPQNTEIFKDMIIKSKLVVGQGSVISGTIKAYDDVNLKENVEVNGDIFSDKDILLDRNCRVWGNLFCQGRIYLASGCEIGTEGIVKSVIGKKGVTLEGNVKIHGYVLTEGSGNTI